MTDKVKLEDKIITVHFSEPETQEEKEAMDLLIHCAGIKYRKTVWRTRKVTEWYKSYRFMVETGKNELSDIDRK